MQRRFSQRVQVRRDPGTAVSPGILLEDRSLLSKPNHPGKPLDFCRLPLQGRQRAFFVAHQPFHC